MNPRRPISKKWTAIPQDYTKQVVEALRESFKDEVRSGKFIVEGRIYPDELLIRMGFLENGRLKQQNFEISLDYTPGKDDTVKLLNLAMDVGATMLEELFSSVDDQDFPKVWQPFEVDGRVLYLQFSGTNTDLERQADQLLGDAEGKKLLQGGDEVSAGEIKKALGLDDDGIEDGEED